ncbi:hypothetical protein RE0356_20720 [Prescottella equi]|nr:hypothetical protein RE0356_20720 [Prescottella equi]
MDERGAERALAHDRVGFLRWRGLLGGHSECLLEQCGDLRREVAPELCDTPGVPLHGGGRVVGDSGTKASDMRYSVTHDVYL